MKDEESGKTQISDFFLTVWINILSEEIFESKMTLSRFSNSSNYCSDD